MADDALPPHLGLRWLHVPKSGSAFINVVSRFGCPVLRGTNHTFDIALNFTQWLQQDPQRRQGCTGLLAPWGAHVPVQRHEMRSGSARVLVGVFRRPAQRLISGFHHREGGRADAMIAPGMPAGERAAMRRSASHDPGMYVRWPGIAGCATKMLLGSDCASKLVLHAEDAARAVSVLREHFAFVGLTERWALSVCVFHALLMRGVPVDAAELALTHAGAKRPTALLGGRSGRSAAPAGFEYDEAVLQGFVDVHDERVYAAARARFWSDVRRTGCAQRLDVAGHAQEGG